jgi:hypothetical protein
MPPDRRLPPDLERLDALRSVPAAGLALAAASVVLTNTTCWLCPRVCASYDASSLTYAAFSWVAVGLLAVLLAARRVPLRTLGLRFPTRTDCVWALAAFAIGIFVVYPVMTGINTLLGTPMTGMNINFRPGRQSVAVYCLPSCGCIEAILPRRG